MVVVGKQPELSLGMTIDELADFMKNLGCIKALNLDGGGSTTFVYAGRVINQPTGSGGSDEEGKRILRPVSDVILITCECDLWDIYLNFSFFHFV